MEVADFDYPLPAGLIAQAPLPERDASRLLVLPRREGPPQHRGVRDLPELLRPGDLMVANDARVIPARLRGRKADTGGKVELLLVEPLGGADWLALGQASKPLRAGAQVEVFENFVQNSQNAPGGSRIAPPGSGSFVQIVQIRSGGQLVVRLPFEGDALWEFLERAGELPLPPYIEHKPSQQDRERYQTVFARERGAVAAPTAGLHFTPTLIEALRVRNVQFVQITLHVGPGTFLPVRVQRTEDHRMHSERYSVSPAAAEAIARTRAAGGRVIAVGTTALRTLEASQGRAGSGATDLFVTPGYDFRAADGLLTNFHLPKSTLFMLVSAFAGLDRVKAAYAEAVARRYRFFSYGDAMLMI